MKFLAFSSLPIVMKQRLGIMPEWISQSCSYEILHREEDIFSPPAIHLDEEDLRRVDAAAEHFPLELEFQRMNGGSTRSTEVRLYRFRNAVLVGGDLFRGGSRMRLQGGRSHSLFLGALPEIPTGALASTQLGCQFFGHWLLDDIPRLEELSKRGETPYFVGTAMSRHQREYMDRWGIAPPLYRYAYFEDLAVLDGNSMQTARASLLGGLRDRTRAAATARAVSGVMLLRGSSGRKRLLSNEAELAEILAAKGFEIIDPMTTSVRNIADACAAANIVVGVEGSHMTHAIFCLPAGASFLTIQPPFKFDNTCKPYCDALGVKYAFTVGLATNEGFAIEPERVLKAIDKVLAETPRKASFCA